MPLENAEGGWCAPDAEVVKSGVSMLAPDVRTQGLPYIHNGLHTGGQAQQGSQHASRHSNLGCRQGMICRASSSCPALCPRCLSFHSINS